MDLLSYSYSIFNAVGSAKIKISNNYPELLSELLAHTKFLQESATINERAFNIIHNITNQTKCKVCNNIVPFISNGSHSKYRLYCSQSCSIDDINVRTKKMKHTNIKKYGVENVFQCKQIQAKQHQTNLDRYGVKHTVNLPHVKQKQKQTNLEKYGVEYYTQSKEMVRKTKQTNLEKYGVESTLQLPEIRNKQRETMWDKYDRIHANQQHLSKKNIKKINDKNWLQKQHNTKKLSIEEISLKLGCSSTLIQQKFKNFNIQIKYHYQSIGQQEIHNFITSKLNNAPEYNIRSVIHPYELDIYIPSHNLAIEYCGLYWHSEQQGKDKQYHKRKHNLCKNMGIQLITIFEDEWQQKQKQVKNKILTLLNNNDQKKIYARKANIIEVPTRKKQEFFDNNHIQGNGPGSINIGLEYNDTLIACMSFIKQKHQHYLNRYATSCNVPGGFSRLLRYFQINYEWQHLISFADLRWSNGNLYEKTKWILDSILPPDYYYSPDGKNRYHKFNYRRKDLPKLLKKFNPELSEWENCKANKILRIWDCGKMRFVLTNDAN